MKPNSNRVRTTSAACTAALVMLAAIASMAQTLDLSGQWRFALDPQNKGVGDNWFNQSLSQSIKLPGILQSQGFGDEISTQTPWVLSLYDRSWFERADYKEFTKPGSVKVPFLAQPQRHYIGPAWYQRDIDVSNEMASKRIVLFLERPRWETTVWVDDRQIGSNRSLVAPHEYDLGSVAPGKHRLTIRVDTSMILPYRPDAHSVSDSLGQSWNGIAGKIELRGTNRIWIDDVQISTRKTEIGYTATARIKIGNTSGSAGDGIVSISGLPGDKEIMGGQAIKRAAAWTVSGGEFMLEFGIAGKAWDEFDPKLNRLRFSIGDSKPFDTRDVSFGIREIRAVGKEFQLNGRRIYLRGNHHGGDFPLTGYPPTDVAYWRRIFQIQKDWGLNHIRFHSFCPPDAAFQAADELGMYVQPEPGMWNEVSPGTPMEQFLYDETDRMIRAYGNHPSFLLFSPGNEPKGRWKEAFDKWIAHYRIADPRRLYSNGTGHTEKEVPGLAEGTDYLAMQRIGPKMLRGNTAWFGLDYKNSLTDINLPVVSHELGQWAAFPDFSVIKKFTGYLKGGNFEIFRSSLARKGLAAKEKQFTYASGKYQLECYKEEIEANLRTPGLDGFQLLDVHDYIGQGTALVGLLDAFWEEKGYATAAEFRRFNNSTVPLARLKKRVFTSNETIEIPVELAHFGSGPMESAQPVWKIVNAKGLAIMSGTLPVRQNVPIGKNFDLGTIRIDANKLVQSASSEFKLIIGLRGTAFENDWNFWVYPEKVEAPSADIVVTSSWTEAESALANGGKVLYSPRIADLDWTSPPLDTLPVFWNRLMNPAWGRMLGLWIDKAHPALASFPTEEYFDWQWSEIVDKTRAVNLDKLPAGLQPIVQPIDDWNRNYKLGLIFEAKVGRGRLMVSSVDLQNGLDGKPVTRQLRKSMLAYMNGPGFNPKISVTPENFRSIFFDTQVMKKLGAKASVAGTDAAMLIDGDPNTFWQGGDPRSATRANQQITISFPNPAAVAGLVIMPRQNGREHEGDIREYTIETSTDGSNWALAKRGELASTFDPQTVNFGKVIQANFIRLTSLSGFGADKTTALAEIAVQYAGPKLAPGDIETIYQRNQAASPDIDEGERRDTVKPKKP